MPRRGLISFVVAALAVVACSGGDDTGDDTADDGQEASDTGAGAPASPSPSPSAACDGPDTGPADLVESTFASDGVDRRYLLSAPAWAEGDEPLPLVVDFHGLAEGADVHAQMTQLGPLGAAEGFVTVFPHGTGEPVAWDVTPDVAGNADLRYVAALLDRVEAERCVDIGRVYATGLSNGAMMTSTVACTMADRFAAVAPIAGIIRPEPCDAERPVPVLSIHGTADPILLFNGGFNAAALGDVLGGDAAEAATTTTTAGPDLDGEGYPATVRDWAEANGCEPEPEDEPVGEAVIRRSYDCPDAGPVVFYIVEGGGHSWPSSEFSRSIEGIVGPTTFEIDASREVWDFVREFRIEP